MKFRDNFVRLSFSSSSSCSSSFFSYSDNPAYGNAVEVEDDLLKQKNELRVKEWYRCVSKEQVTEQYELTNHQVELCSLV